jgi:HAE1 family hydrophobic/amphiphilic exporter-1
MVPMALGTGPGAAARASMAKVILGGQALSLLLTLLVTPVAYSLWEDLGRVLRHLWARAGPKGAPDEGLPAKLERDPAYSREA